MNQFSFFRVSAAIPNVALANPRANADAIIDLIDKAAAIQSSLIVFPELSLTGYSCADLFNHPILINAALKELPRIEEASAKAGIWSVVGIPVVLDSCLYNCAAFISPDKGLVGLVPKTYLPNYNEFYEKRWFKTGKGLVFESIRINGKEIHIGTDILFEINGVKVGAEICEDLWVPAPPSLDAVLSGADLIVNLSATDEMLGKHDYLKKLLAAHSAALRCGYVYASAGWGESSTDLVFSGNGFIYENGSQLAAAKRFSFEPQIITADLDIELIRNDRRRFSSFSEKSVQKPFYTCNSKETTGAVKTATKLLRHVSPSPFVPSDPSRLNEHCSEIISIQSWGLARRLKAVGNGKVVVGISGGLDSTLALLVAVNTARMTGKPLTDIVGITMPGFGTTSRTRSNAELLMERLGVTMMEIPIGDAVNIHFRDLKQDPALRDATYENSQARERTQILMDMANKVGGIVLGTGDLSELALGWCTYNGDQMSMYGVNASIPKTLVQYLINWFAEQSDDPETTRILRDIIDTPISPELIPAEDNSDSIAQKTEDLVGPYALHDFFLFHTLRNSFSPEKIEYLANIAFEGVYDSDTIRHWLKNFYRRFFNQQFKRSCMPDGPKVGSVCLSPRGDWRMPSDASSALWSADIK